MNSYGNKAKRSNTRLAGGFTLIEVMIVVAVIGLLATIALPSYRSYVIKANRSAGQQIMVNIQNREEMHMADARAYTNLLGSTGLNISQDGWNCTSVATKCSNANYDVTVAVATSTPPTFTITATALGNQVSDGNMTLTSAGARARSAGDGKW